MAIESNRNQDASGDLIQTIDVWGKDGTNRFLSAQIKFIVDGTVNTGKIPMRIEFWTATTGGTLTKALTIDAAQAATLVGTLAHAGTNLFSFGSGGIETPITAGAGGTQGNAVALSATKSVHNVTTVTSGNDSVVLPAATGSGKLHWVKNSAVSNSCQLFGLSADTIDAVTAATGVAIAAGKSRIVVDTASGLWQSILGA